MQTFGIEMKKPIYRFQKRIAGRHIESVLAGCVGPSGEPWDISAMQRDLLDADHVITAWSGSELIGFASALAQGSTVTLSWLFVRPDCQRKGIGKKLVTDLLARFDCASNASVVANQAAAKFYRSCGFAPAPHVVPMMKKLNQ